MNGCLAADTPIQVEGLLVMIQDIVRLWVAAENRQLIKKQSTATIGH